MKINIIGGGPAGLYFGILIKKADPRHEVRVWERNGPDDTFGWGVVFSGRTLANLRQADDASHTEITQAFEAWDNVDVVHRGEKVSIHGNSFSGISRLRLLKILQKRCEQLGVEVLFYTETTDVDALRRDCDFLVGADGVNSAVRQRFSDSFAPTLNVRSNRYIWYGTNRLFHGLTLTFRENKAGVFAAHSYKFSKTTSTFIVECDEQTWKNAGFANMSEAETRAYLVEAFREDLNDQPLLSNNSKWINFVLVKNARWRHDNVGLLGDALHTAHFSIGSGTKLALEDAIELNRCFGETLEVEKALAAFESLRKPVIEDFQAAAYESMIWFENARRYMPFNAVELAYSLMMRSGRVDEAKLKMRDPNFVAAYEKSIKGCFRGETKVRTEHGWKNIQCVLKGERVWTHRGRLRSVVGSQARPHVGRLIGLRLEGSAVVVWCTAEQRFLVPYTPSPHAERGLGGEVTGCDPTPFIPSPLAGRGNPDSSQRRLGGFNPELVKLARQLRAQTTSAERILWECLRNRRLNGAKFRHQHPLGANYIADFYCPKAQLAVELDGSVHDSFSSQWADGIRHRQIQQAGIRVLRFRNERVVDDTEGVLLEIAEYVSPALREESESTPPLWCHAGDLSAGTELQVNERGEQGLVDQVETVFANETVYDLTIEEDHSFVTEAGVAHNHQPDLKSDLSGRSCRHSR